MKKIYKTKESKNKSLIENNKRYWKTKKGKLMLTYNNMNRRVRGIQKAKAHLYENLELLSREDFYNWSSNNADFDLLYMNWVLSDYDRKLSPSIDRVDSSKGYVIDNIRWITHSENSRLGHISRYSKNT